jgi:alpha-tubulin suppressor-like RCC1 family protein
VKAIAAGDNHTCALTNTEEVRCWGRNAAGQLGNGTTTNSSTPVSVLFFAKALEAGGDATCAVNKPILQNTVNTFCWGSNTYGQLGDGTTTGRTIPSLIPGISGTTDVTVGFRHSCALKSDGTVSCWGFNSYGQLGNGTTVNRPNPTAVTGLTDVASIVAGDDHTCALKNNGTARCWGRGVEGQLGYGDVTNIPAPVYVLNSDGATALNGLSALTAGYAHTCGLKNDGTTKCWGNNAYGQLGDGTYTTRLLATTVTGLSGVMAINLGVDHTCALKNDGSAQCWGSNSYGQLGNTSVSNRNTPTSVTGGAIFWK